VAAFSPGRSSATDVGRRRRKKADDRIDKQIVIGDRGTHCRYCPVPGLGTCTPTTVHTYNTMTLRTSWNNSLRDTSYYVKSTCSNCENNATSYVIATTVGSSPITNHSNAIMSTNSSLACERWWVMSDEYSTYQYEEQINKLYYRYVVHCTVRNGRWQSKKRINSLLYSSY